MRSAAALERTLAAAHRVRGRGSPSGFTPRELGERPGGHSPPPSRTQPPPSNARTSPGTPPGTPAGASSRPLRWQRSARRGGCRGGRAPFSCAPKNIVGNRVREHRRGARVQEHRRERTSRNTVGNVAGNVAGNTCRYIVATPGGSAPGAPERLQAPSIWPPS